MQKLLVAAAITLGLFFAYVDSRPTWDDAGVMAFSIAIAAAILSFLAPQRPWLWALCIGGWIPFLTIIRSHGFASLVALVFAFAGAYLGAGLRKLALHAPGK